MTRGERQVREELVHVDMLGVVSGSCRGAEEEATAGGRIPLCGLLCEASSLLGVELLIVKK